MDRNLMEKFRKTLKMLEECRSVEDALKVLETVTEQAAASVILPVTRERVQEIVAEFERDLRQGRIPSTVSLRPELEKSLNKFLVKMKVASDESDSSRSNAESQNSMEEKMKTIVSMFGITKMQVPALQATIIDPSDSIEDAVTSPQMEENSASAPQVPIRDQSELKMCTDNLKENSGTSLHTEENSATALQVTIRAQSVLKTCTDILIEDPETSPQTDETEDDFEDLQHKYSMPKIKPPRVFRNEKSLKRTIQTICVEFQPYNWYLIDCVTEFLLLSFHAMFAHASWIKEVQDAGGNLNDVKHRDICTTCWGKINCYCGVDLNCKDRNVGKVGNVIRAVIHTGQHEDPNDIQSNPTSGVEVVLIKMDQPLIDKSLCLPASIYKQWKDLGLPKALHFKGKVLEYMECPLELPVYKIGKTTGLTIGKVESKNGRYSFMDRNLTLENQLKIRWDKNQPFSAEGDSGSLVFCVKKEQEICSVGILTGSDRGLFSVVTPMSEILNYLSGNCHDYRLKEFMYEEVDGRLIFRVTDRISRK